MGGHALTVSQALEHGQHIFIYGHVRTNQILYSLSRALTPNALAQIPFLGKQTVPASLRKDYWRPLATVTFPSGPQGLSAYRELREFRKRHEHEWTYESLGETSRLGAGRKLRDQKANSIADLAAVLLKQEKREQAAQEANALLPVTEDVDPEQKLKDLKAAMHAAQAEATDEAKDRWKRLRRERVTLRRKVLKAAEKEKNAPAPNPWKLKQQPPSPTFVMDGVRIQWRDLLDAEFAETWPQAVVHDRMPRTRHLAPEPSATNEGEEFDDVVGVAAPRTEDEAAVIAPPPPPSTLKRMVDRLRLGSGTA